MKIVYFNYLADAIGPLIRTLELAKSCSDNGVTVSLYFMNKGFNPPEFVYERIRSYQSERLTIHYNNRNEKQLIAEAESNGVQAKSPGEPRIRLRGLLKQSALSLLYIPAEIKIIRREKADAVMARPDHAFSFCFSSRLAGVPLVLDTDGPVEELDLYWGISSRGLSKLDTFRARSSSAVSVVSNVCEELWHNKISDRKRFFIVPNGTHQEEFLPQPVEKREELATSLGLQECRVIGYSGNQRVWHGLPNLLRSALPLLKNDKKLKILIIGCGFNEDLMEECGIPESIFRHQVVFTGRLSYWDMAAHIDLADIMVMPYDKLPLFYFSPMRMFEAMSLGKSLITSDQGQMHDLLDERSSVRFFDPADTNDLHRVIKTSIYDDDFIQSGLRNREYLIAEHTWRARGAQIKEAITYAVANY
jgi:glycosyltransferase involved in cell wall biosynthesis